MDAYRIVGGKRLSGKIESQSAKNSILALMVAATLTDEQVIIEKCPKITDVFNMIEILSSLGIESRFEQDALILQSYNRKGFCVEQKFTSKIRASFYLAGALTAMHGRAEISMPGGCSIGKRPIDEHLKAFQSLGIQVDDGGDVVRLERQSFCGGEYVFRIPSFGATVNAVLCSVISDKTTTLKNVAREPEIVDLANFLNKMGAKIQGAGSRCIVIEGVKNLHGIRYKPIFDRIEVGTYLLATAITRGEIEISNVNMQNIRHLLHKISNYSCQLVYKNDIIHIKFDKMGRAFDFCTMPYPGFPTDLQSQTLAYLCLCDGVSYVTENLFENRFSCIEQLNKMGANVKTNGRVATVKGVEFLTGCDVLASDLRSGAALVIAGLGARGQTTVHSVNHVERGYENMVQKLQRLGADITEI